MCIRDRVNIIPQDISRVFLNIVNNACYDTNEKKKTLGDVFNPVLKVSTKNLKDKVEIRIEDNGNGIPASVKDHIFNPFYTTKPTGEGTGLGLSLSYDIVVKQHNGEIKFNTVPGEFTEFIICLLYTSDAADERSSVDLGGRRIIKKKNTKSLRGSWAIITHTKKKTEKKLNKLI